MTRIFRFALPVCLAVLFHANQLQAAAATAQWTQPGSLAEARSGSAAAVLSDGRVLITGGTGSSGPLATTEFFNTDGSFSAGAPMQDARANHTAVVLQDGRVLVAGGTTTGGAITNTAEIYNPSSNSWTLVGGGMAQLRSGHSASLLSDGRVLIAGGQNTSGPTHTLETFSPGTNSFTPVTSGTLSSPRTKHAAAVLADGRVLIAGGSDGANALSSADIFDPSSGNVSPTASMSMPRAGLSATTLLDGTVLVAGGNNGSADLASAEKYDPATGAFSATGNLNVARSGHLAFLLANNNEVLIAGGTSAGAPLASAELFVPWAGSFNSTGAMAVARTAAAGSPLKQNGQLVVAGGSDGKNSLASSELYSFATITTDQADYPPGTTVNISGSGWQPGETVTLALVESPLYDTHGPYSAVADSNGNIFNNQFMTDEHDANIRFYLTARGSVSQAQMTFTDSTQLKSLTVGEQTGSLTAGTAGSVTYPITVGFNGNGSCTVNLSVTTALPSGVQSSFNPSSLSGTGTQTVPATLTITTSSSTPTGTTGFTVKVAGTGVGGNDCKTTDTLTQPATLVVGAAGPATSLITWNNPADITYGTPLNGTQLNATASVGGTAVPGSFTYSPAAGTVLSAGNSQTLSVTFTPTDTTKYTTVNKTVSINVNKATPTVTVTGGTYSYDGQPHPATVSITGVSGDNSLTSSMVTLTYTPAVSAPVNVGSYSVKGTFGGNTNYNSATSNTATITINKANATIAVTAYSVAYDGNAHTGTGTAKGVNGEVLSGLDLSGTTHTNAGVYSDNWTFTDPNGNYNSTSGSVNDSIAKVNANVTVTPYSVTYDGNAHTATGTAIGVKGEPLNGLNLTGTIHTNAGTYADAWTFTDSTGNYNNISGTVTDSITAATTGATTPTQSGTSTYGTSVTLSVTISTASGAGTPNGTVQFQFTNGGTTYNVCSNGSLQPQPAGTPCTITLNDGTATVTTSSLPAGITPDSITATYNPADSNYQSASTTITYTVNTASTQTTISITPDVGATYGDAITLSSAVSNTAQGSTGTPTGSVQFQYSIDGGATWVNIGSPVTLDTSAKAQTTTTVLPAGQPAVRAEYLPDNNFTAGNSGPTAYKVDPKALTVSGITASNKPYDGKTAAALDTSNAQLTGVIGTEDVHLATTGATGTFADANAGTGKTVTIDGLSLTGTAKSNYTLKQVTATANITAVQVTVTAPSQIVTYGDPIPAPLTPEYNAFVNGEGSDVLTTQPTCTTTYTPTSPAGSNQTTSCSGAVAMNYTFTYANGAVTVNKANAVIQVTPYSVTYDGNAHTAAGTVTGVKGEALSGLDLSATTHTDAGTYSDKWTFTDSTGNYKNTSGTVSDAIAKANVTVTVTGGTFTYNASAHPATATIAGVTGDTSLTPSMVTISYTPGDTAAPVNAGTYQVAGSFAGNQNYKAATGAAMITINKADAKIAVTGGTYTYDANSHPATATVTGVTGDSSLATATVTLTYSPGETAPVNAGSYKATASFAGNQNYNPVAGSDTITINKANAKVTVTPYSVTYDGTAHTATGTATGVKEEALTGLDLSATTHTNAGTTTDTWTFTEATGNYNDTKGTVSDAIAKANVTVTVTGGAFTYDANAHPATATIAGVTGDTSLTPSLVTLSYSPGGTEPVNAGTYTATGTFTGSSNYNPGSGTATITIDKATPALTVTGGTYTYDAKPHAGSATITGVQGDNSLASLVTLTYTPGGTAPVNAGAYQVTGSFAGNSNYNPVNSTPANIMIGQASATIVVQGYTGPYDGNAHGATGSAKGVTGEVLSNLLHLGSSFTNVPGGTANWSFDGNVNYQPANGTAPINIAQVPLTITAAPASRAFGLPNPTFSVAYSGFVPGQSPAVLGAPPSCTSPATPLSDVGVYPITCGGQSSTNYAISYLPGTLTITAAPTTTTLASGLSQMNGAVTVSFTATISSTVTPAGGSVTFVDGSNNNAVLGTSGLTSGKASITIQAGSLAAGPHVITATYAPTSADFTGSTSAANPAPGVTITNPSSGAVNPITSPVNFSATLSGVAANTNPCACAEWTFTNTGTSASTSGAGTISGTTITGSNTFVSAGVFGVTLTFTDGSGDVVIANTVSYQNAPANLPATVVIYDASAGFVTGGGWINSPVGAYITTPSLTGKATFGFVSKYQKGANVPTGDTQFQFKAGNLDFHSTVYQWMVISGGLAQYKGSGTINGAGNYNFLLTARDGNLVGNNSPDGFRIKITDASTGGLVYDNVPGNSDAMSSGNTQALDGGSVIIHSN